jgi:hypothetical protein
LEKMNRSRAQQKASASDFVALAVPGKLTLMKASLLPAMTINWALACAGGAQGSGEALLAVGSEPEVEAALARTRALPSGGECCVEYSPVRDEVRVSLVTEATRRTRELLAAGALDPELWFAVSIGETDFCEREATRLRRIRAGKRAAEGAPK